MKKLILLIGFVLFSFNVSGQKNYKTYESSFFAKTFDIQIGRKNSDGNFVFYVDAVPKDNNTLGKLMVHSEKVFNLVTSLNDAKATYNRWKDVAAANNVTELDKKMPVQFPNLNASFYSGNQWYFDYSVKMNARFKIIDDGFALIIESEALKSDDIHCKGVHIVFKNMKELDEFISCFDLIAAESFLDTQASIEALFN